MDSPDGSYQPTLSLSGAKWQLDGGQAAAMTACRVGWHDCCLPASERSGRVVVDEKKKTRPVRVLTASPRSQILRLKPLNQIMNLCVNGLLFTNLVSGISDNATKFGCRGDGLHTLFWKFIAKLSCEGYWRVAIL